MQAIARQSIKYATKKGLQSTAKTGVEGAAIVGLNYAVGPEDHLNNILGGLSSAGLAAIPGIGPVIAALMIGGLVIDAINPGIVELTNPQLDAERKIYFDSLVNIATKLGEKRPESFKMFAVPVDLKDPTDIKAYGGHLRDYITQNKLLLGDEAVMAADALAEQATQNRLNRFRRFFNVAELATKEYVSKVNRAIYQEKRRIETRRKMTSFMSIGLVSASAFVGCLICLMIIVALSSKS